MSKAPTRAENEAIQSQSGLGVDSARVEVLADTFEKILRTMSQRQREELRQRLAELLAPPRPTPRRESPALSNVVDFMAMNEKKEIMVVQVKDYVRQRDAAVSAKQVDNAIMYLRKMGHLRRIDYGRYLVLSHGFEFVDPNDLRESS